VRGGSHTVLVFALALFALFAPPSFAGQGASDEPIPPAAEVRSEIGPASALRLFASVEDAWIKSDAERLASMVDTTSVRIAVKPGVPPTAALTRGAAAFLFQDQLRLVRTSGFRFVRFEVNSKRPTARATATWMGDWGGQRGKRAVDVTMTARSVGGVWLLTEIRAED